MSIRRQICVGSEANGEARAEIAKQTELLNKFATENNYEEVLKCRIRIISAFDQIQNSTESSPFRGYLNHAKNLLDDESWDHFARLYGPLASERYVEALVAANQIQHRCKSIARYLIQLDDANRMLSELQTKLNSLESWGLLQLKPGSSSDDVERSYRELSEMLVTNEDEDMENLPEDVVEFNKALLNRVKEAHRRLSVQRRPLCELARASAGYISSEEAKTELNKLKSVYKQATIMDKWELAKIKLQITNILRKWMQIEPNLINDHIKKINYLLDREFNFEALVKAKYYQCSLWRELDPNKFDSFVASIEIKLNALGPYGWLQLKPYASKKEAEKSYKKLKTIFNTKDAESELDDMPIDMQLFSSNRKNLNNELAYAFDTIQEPNMNLIRKIIAYF